MKTILTVMVMVMVGNGWFVYLTLALLPLHDDHGLMSCVGYELWGMKVYWYADACIDYYYSTVLLTNNII